MSPLTICQFPFGLKRSLSGKCFRFLESSPSRWKIREFALLPWQWVVVPGVFMQALGCTISLHQPCWILSFPWIVNTCPAGIWCWKLEISLNLVMAWWASLLTQLMLCLVVILTCLLAWAALGHRVIFLQQISYFPVFSLEQWSPIPRL